MNYRPLTLRKKIQLLTVLTILAWATTTLLHQWGYGAEIPAQPTEKFISAEPHPATLEIRAETTVHGTEVKLRQLCRWADSDASFFAPMADLIIARCKADAPFQSVSLDEIRRTLHDAGVNVAMIRFSGPLTCTITRSDVQYDERSALQEWAAARQGNVPARSPEESTTKASSLAKAEDAAILSRSDLKVSSTPVAVKTEPAVHTLRDLIVADAVVRLNVPADQLQINFSPADDKVLALPETQFKFDVQARRVYNLGDVAWDVTVLTDTGSKRIPIAATARAWQKQVVVSKPLAYKQVIRDGDVTERRILADRIPDEPLLSLQQAVGQQASRELKPGTILTARMVDPVQLIKTGQLVTVNLSQGAISVKTVLRAAENGSYGQTIRVKNETTRETYEVVVTGPQEATLSPVPEEKRVADAGNGSGVR